MLHPVTCKQAMLQRLSTLSLLEMVKGNASEGHFVFGSLCVEDRKDRESATCDRGVSEERPTISGIPKRVNGATSTLDH